MNEAIINLGEIDSVEVSSTEIESKDGVRRLSIFGTLEPHNVILRLNREKTLLGLYGVKKRYRVLLLHVDDKTTFVNSIMRNE